MKKLAVLSITLLMLTTLAFAEVMVEPQVEFSGSGTLTWGIDLNSLWMNGFLNESEANLTVTLVPESTETKGGAEGDTVFGFISLSDMKLVFNTDDNNDLPADMAIVDLDGDDLADPGTYVAAPDVDTISVPTAFLTAPTVEAYVMLGPVKWFIYAAPDLEISYAQPIEDESEDDDVDNWAEDEEEDIVLPDYGDGATGIEVVAGPATITALVASVADWTATREYFGALKLALDLDPIAVGAGFNISLPTTVAGVSTSIIGLGGSLGLTAGPAVITAALDAKSTSVAIADFPLFNTSVFELEIAGGVTLTLPDVMTLTANAALGQATATILSIPLTVPTWGLDVEVGVDLTAVPNLTANALVGLWDILTVLADDPLTAAVDDGVSMMALGVKAELAYKIALGEVNYIKPGVTGYISNGIQYSESAVTAGATSTAAGMRVVLIATVEAVLIPNTTFTVTWTNGDLTANEVVADDHTLTFATTVEY